MTTSTATLLHQLVNALDRSADAILQEAFDISYRRFYLLLILHDCGEVTQHELAVAMGHSDPAVSKMLGDVRREGYVSVAVSTEHARKRKVELTDKGASVVDRGMKLLDSRFSDLMQVAGVNAARYHADTELLQAKLAK